MKKILLFVPLFFVMFSAGFKADAKMSAEWEEKRANYKDIGKASCNDAKSFNKLKTQADNGDDMAAYWVYYTMASNKCKLYSRDLKATHKYRLQTLNSGYPIAYRYVGKDYLYGYGGLKADAQKGLGLLKKSLELGHEYSAAELAYAYGGGRGTSRNRELAMKYYKIAVEAGIEEDTLKVVRKYFSNDLKKTAAKIERTVAAGKNQQSTNASTNTASSSSDENEQFAALAVSMGDGGFGFAHDYPDAKSARSRALNECKSKGGADCDIKMVGRGKGCMAYHYAGGSATAHGWSIGATRNAVETRAAQECQKRNDSKSCSGRAWVCNDRTQAPLKVVMNKPLPNATQAVAGGACKFTFFQNCHNFTNGTHNGKRFAVISVYGFPQGTETFPQCGTDKFRSVSWDRKKNSWSKYSDRKVPENIKRKMKPLLDNFRSRVLAKYPACEKGKGRYLPRTGVVFYASEENYQQSVKQLSEKRPWKRVLN